MSIEGTTPYPWPYDDRIVPETTALVICGADDYWSGCTPLDPDGLANIAALRHAAAELGLLIALVRHHQAAPKVLSGQPELPCPPLVAEAGEYLVEAAGTDGFYGSPLDRLLNRENRTHLLLAGYGFETVVHSTLRRANDRGYECLTVADACLSLDPAIRRETISSIEFSGGIFGAIGSALPTVAAYRAAVNQP